MCVIVYRKKDTKPLDKDIWKECFKMHKDGAGMAFFEETGKLVVDKGYMTFDPLYEEIQKREHLEMVVHFRTASPGMVVNQENTHPFFFNGRLFKTKDGKKPRFRWTLVHNGRLPWHGSAKKSDTACFAEEWLWRHLDRDPFFLDNDTGITILEAFLTTATCTNKLVIMRHDAEDNSNDTYILNEKAGNKAHGCWFSNYSWQAPVHHGYYGGSGFFGHGGAHGEFLDLTNEERWLTPDQHGWSWSFRYDCWVHYVQKKWTTYLPYRKSPYNPHMLNKANHEKPKDMVQVYITMTPDKVQPALTAGDKAEQNKEGDAPPVNNVIPIEGEKRIEVPREDPENTSEYTEGDGLLGVPDLDHLEPEEKALLCKEAVRYLRDMGTRKQDIRKMSTAEKIDWMRDGVKGLCPEAEAMNHIDLDMWMLAHIKDGNLDKKLVTGAEKPGNN